MKIYLQTTTQAPEGAETRPRRLVFETAAPEAQVRPALEALATRLGAITAVPAPPHEHNLERVLPRDLVAAGVVPGEGAEGSLTLRVVRTPGAGPAGQAELVGLSYEVVGG